MHVYYSYIFMLVYFVSTSVVIGIFIYYMYRKTEQHSNIIKNPKNTLLVSKKLILQNKKINHKYKNVFNFPPELYRYIKKPSPKYLTRLLLCKCLSQTKVCNNIFLSQCITQTTECSDVYRCVTISSFLFNKEIPTTFVILDNRTKYLYELIEEDLKLNQIVILSFFKEKIRDTVKKNREVYDHNVEKYESELQVIGEEILKCTEDTSFPSLECFTDIVNTEYNKTFCIEEIQSLSTAFSAITNIKIPKMYINVDILALSLVYFKTLKEEQLNE